MGGCQTCRMDFEPGYLEYPTRYSSDIEKTDQGLISQRQRVFLENQIKIQGVPSEGFWEANQQYKHTCFKQIKKDIMRTFPDSSFFGHKCNLDRFELLLQKYAIFFPRVGYTQGLNFLAGYLLLCGFNDQEAFTMLIQISVHEKIMALGLFQDEFPLNKFYCELFWQLLQKKLPKVYDKMQGATIPDEMWIFQWFISFFLYSFPVEAMRTFWNFILTKKEFSMVLLAFGIVKAIKKDLLLLDDEVDFFQYFQSLKELEFFNSKLDLKKVISNANGITKKQIEEGIQSTTCVNNPYRKYFAATNEMIRRQQWFSMLNKLQSDRRVFRNQPFSPIYARNRDVIQHLQKFVMSQISQYSQARKSKATLKSSTFKLKQSFYSQPLGISFAKRANSFQIQQKPQNKKKFY